MIEAASSDLGVRNASDGFGGDGAGADPAIPLGGAAEEGVHVLRLRAGAQTHAHITSLALDAMNLAKERGVAEAMPT